MIKDVAYAEIISAGPRTLVRDLGRSGYASVGIPVSGPLDSRAFKWNNHLLKNMESDAQIEINQPGFKIRFESDTWICLAGAKAEIKINNQSGKRNELIRISSGDTLNIGKFEKGSILYLGISGGFQSEKVLGSRSQFAGISEADSLNKGIILPYFTNTNPENDKNFAKAKWNESYLDEIKVRVYPGFDWSFKVERIAEKIFSSDLHVSTLRNTMAVQIQEEFPNGLESIPTAPVFPGTVQLTQGGKIICLLSDAQVTGGYPRILQIHEDDLPILAQKKPNQKIRFSLLKD